MMGCSWKVNQMNGLVFTNETDFSISFPHKKLCYLPHLFHLKQKDDSELSDNISPPL